MAGAIHHAVSPRLAGPGKHCAEHGRLAKASVTIDAAVAASDAAASDAACTAAASAAAAAPAVDDGVETGVSCGRRRRGRRLLPALPVRGARAAGRGGPVDVCVDVCFRIAASIDAPGGATRWTNGPCRAAPGAAHTHGRTAGQVDAGVGPLGGFAPCARQRRSGGRQRGAPSPHPDADAAAASVDANAGPCAAGLAAPPSASAVAKGRETARRGAAPGPGVESCRPACEGRGGEYSAVTRQAGARPTRLRDKSQSAVRCRGPVTLVHGPNNAEDATRAVSYRHDDSAPDDAVALAGAGASSSASSRRLSVVVPARRRPARRGRAIATAAPAVTGARFTERASGRRRETALAPLSG
mmetsp:Transcript_3636/g.15134  ORF Transcript_3636/g.15134 Transcript_3636/m.15134 type:complete len:356 (-) Transcript_3636:2149-3216(-)